MKKQTRAIFHTLVADHKFDNDRHAWTITHNTFNANEQKSFLKLSREIIRTDLVSLSCQAEAGRVERSSLGWKVEASDEHVFAINGSTHSTRTIRRTSREEQWNLDSVKAVLIRSWELKVSTKHIRCQSEVHHESSVGQTRSYTTVHKMRLGYRSAFI